MLFCNYFSQYAIIIMKILIVDQENIYYKFNGSYPPRQSCIFLGKK